jgi:hypothetical protein
MNENIPSIVRALAEQVKMTPIAWNVKPETVVIVFEQGQKLTFERVAEPALEPRTRRTITVNKPKNPQPKNGPVKLRSRA